MIKCIKEGFDEYFGTITQGIFELRHRFTGSPIRCTRILVGLTDCKITLFTYLRRFRFNGRICISYRWSADEHGGADHTPHGTTFDRVHRRHGSPTVILRHGIGDHYSLYKASV